VIWLIIINLNGGQPAALPMQTMEACLIARDEASIPFLTRTACISAGVAE